MLQDYYSTVLAVTRTGLNTCLDETDLRTGDVMWKRVNIVSAAIQLTFEIFPLGTARSVGDNWVYAIRYTLGLSEIVKVAPSPTVAFCIMPSLSSVGPVSWDARFTQAQLRSDA